MIVLPVLERELRAQSRRPLTYWLRVGGLAALLLFTFYFKSQGSLNTDHGGRLFGFFNSLVFFGIWLVVPFITADCISRERREGTLGLLFLTPLNARNIVLAKSIAHGLHALTLWVAVLPALVIPFLLGGITWREILLSVLINFSSVCGALAAGILASAYSRSWLRALLLAAGIAVVFLFLLLILKAAALIKVMDTYGPQLAPGQFNLELLFESLQLAADVQACWGDLLGRLPLLADRWWLIAEGAQAVASLLALWLVIEMAARKVRRDWQDKSASRRQLWVDKTFFRPVLWLGFFRRWMRRKLELNPIGWLEQRTWSGRAALWGWLGMIILIYSLTLTDVDLVGRSNLPEKTMGWLLLGNLVISAAGSFRRERESGVMELLLVSPLNETEIITGRLRGLWGQFLPAWALLIVVWIYFLSVFGRHGFPDDSLISMFCFLVSFGTLPIIGLYFSLRQSSFATAVLLTLLWGILLPAIVAYPASFVFTSEISGPPAPDSDVRGFFSAVMQIIISLAVSHRLRVDLVRRNFSFQRAGA